MKIKLCYFCNGHLLEPDETDFYRPDSWTTVTEIGFFLLPIDKEYYFHWSCFKQYLGYRKKGTRITKMDHFIMKIKERYQEEISARNEAREMEALLLRIEDK